MQKTSALIFREPPIPQRGDLWGSIEDDVIEVIGGFSVTSERGGAEGPQNGGGSFDEQSLRGRGLIVTF